MEKTAELSNPNYHLAQQEKVLRSRGEKAEWDQFLEALEIWQQQRYERFLEDMIEIAPHLEPPP